MSKRKQFREMDELDELDILDQKDPVEEALDFFFAEGMITEILYLVKSGKEATVYCCEAHPSTGMELIAAKIYRSRNQRNFKNDAIYLEGRVITKARVRRAIENKSRFGRQVGFGMWINNEFEVLTALSRAGADIPHPIARTDTALLMEYFGDREAAAPSLASSQLTREQAESAFDNLLDNIELWLAHN